MAGEAIGELNSDFHEANRPLTQWTIAGSVCIGNSAAVLIRSVGSLVSIVDYTVYSIHRQPMIAFSSKQ